MTKYEVQEYCLCGGWTNTWRDEDKPSVFDSEESAQAELDEFLKEMAEEVAAGNLQDCSDRDDFRIVEVPSLDTIKVTRIGTIPLGVDGQDLYLKLEDFEADITADRIEDFFATNYYAETHQEAGGYFCRHYNWLPFNHSTNTGVLVIYQQYDV